MIARRQWEDSRIRGPRARCYAPHVRTVRGACIVLGIAAGCAGPHEAAAPSAGASSTARAARQSEPRATEQPVGGRIEGAPEDLFRVVVVSDINGDYGSTEYGEDVHGAMRAIVAMQPDLVISTGDLVAGERAGLDYRAMWRGFRAAVGDPLAAAAIPFAPTPGNHDASGYSRYADEREVFVDEWRERRPEVELVDGSRFPLRYSFVAGGALFVSLDATTVGPIAAEEKAWLHAQLDAERARRVKIVYGHLPIQPFTHGREREVLADTELESILLEGGVTLYLSGHHHAYYPGRHGALRVVSVGCLGGGPRALLGTDEPSPRSFLLIEIDGDEVRRVDAMLAPDFDTPVERASLPERLGEVVRDDL